MFGCHHGVVRTTVCPRETLPVHDCGLEDSQSRVWVCFVVVVREGFKGRLAPDLRRLGRRDGSGFYWLLSILGGIRPMSDSAHHTPTQRKPKRAPRGLRDEHFASA